MFVICAWISDKYMTIQQKVISILRFLIYNIILVKILMF